jgi:hypothetical protein
MTVFVCLLLQRISFFFASNEVKRRLVLDLIFFCLPCMLRSFPSLLHVFFPTFFVTCGRFAGNGDDQRDGRRRPGLARSPNPDQYQGYVGAGGENLGRIDQTAGVGAEVDLPPELFHDELLRQQETQTVTGVDSFQLLQVGFHRIQSSAPLGSTASSRTSLIVIDWSLCSRPNRSGARVRRTSVAT